MVGDVVGHDVEAAVAMGRLRAGVAALAGISAPRPAALLRALDVCARGSQPVDYVTACALVIDPATGRMAAASAGHPPALIVTPSGQTVWLDSALATDRQHPARANRRTHDHAGIRVRGHRLLRRTGRASFRADRRRTRTPTARGRSPRRSPGGVDRPGPGSRGTDAPTLPTGDDVVALSPVLRHCELTLHRRCRPRHPVGGWGAVPRSTNGRSPTCAHGWLRTLSVDRMFASAASSRLQRSTLLAT